MLRYLENNILLRALYFDKSEQEQGLLLSAFFSIALCFARVFYTEDLLFISLIWNLFLAFIPYAVSTFVSLSAKWWQTNMRFAFAFIAWLLFIPNAFYILTDLFHLQKHSGVPLWYDLALILSFAWTGLLLGILSVRQMERIIETKWKLGNGLLFILPIMFLNAFGIYLGRYLRYNSWDVITKPFGLIEDMVYLIIHPLRNRFDWGMIICYAILMTLIYSSIKRISKSVW